MIYPTTTKDVVSVEPQTKLNDASATCASVDRKGFDFASVKLILGANDAGLAVCKLQESDDNSSWTDIPGADFSTSGTLPGGSDQNKIFGWEVDLRGRKRYLRPAITIDSGSTGAYLAVLVQLARAEQSPHDAGGRGHAQTLNV